MEGAVVPADGCDVATPGRKTFGLRGIACLLVLMSLPLFGASARDGADASAGSAGSDACAGREYQPSRADLEAALGRLAGLWEAQEPDNHWRMEVRAKAGGRILEGILVRNGKRSRDVGFSVGEHVFTARVAPDRPAIVIDQKWRFGRNGRSISVQWLSGELDLCRSGVDRMVTADGYVYRRIR